jgi:predicted double-glycine peptidase
VRCALAIFYLFWQFTASAVAADFDFLPANGTPYSVPVRSMQELRFRTTVKQQYDFSCGSAALATLLTYHYEHGVDEASVLGQMFASGDQEKIRREGFSMLDMKRYLARLGFSADGYQVDLSQLADARIPAIALLTRDGYRHFVVVKGISPDRVLIGDPSRGTRSISRSRFEESQSGIFLVIRDRADIGSKHFNERQEWSGSGRNALDQTVERFALESRVVTGAR